MEEEKGNSCGEKEYQATLIFNLRRTDRNGFKKIEEIIQSLEKKPEIKIRDINTGGFSDRVVKLTGEAVVLTEIIEEIKADLGERVFVGERLPVPGIGRMVVC